MKEPASRERAENANWPLLYHGCLEKDTTVTNNLEMCPLVCRANMAEEPSTIVTVRVKER